MVNPQESWYIVKQSDGYCDIISHVPEAPQNNADDSEGSSALDNWGPFPSQAEAIAKRIGLIRAGKCQPR